MPANLNPRTVELLSWHGHSRGGVHVPFQLQANPLGQTIATNIVLKLRGLAQQIATSPTSLPRWIFLVGGPGNGKSETVQDFLQTLDSALGLGGALRDVLRAKFTPNPLLPRKVEVVPSDLAVGQTQFATKVGRLILVQDATATETAGGNAARELAEDIVALTSVSGEPTPIFVACVNRGLLARALHEASKITPASNARDILEQVIRASSLGQDALAGRPSCWPLDGSPNFACWPLDVESLLTAPASQAAPFELILDQAADAAQWEINGRCADCSSRLHCPFRQNAEWLRDPVTRKSFVKVLRHGELTKGQRWNFRDALSLTAETFVGQWSDFSGELSPCAWVHKLTPQISVSAAGTKATVSLVRHLYPHALFRGTLLEKLGDNLRGQCRIDAVKHQLSNELSQALTQGVEASTKPIREILARDYARLDPGVYGASDEQALRNIEDGFCQSVSLGKSTLPPPSLSPIESLLLELLSGAEQEWDVMARDYTHALRAVCTFRQIGAIIAKRSIGVRIGATALGKVLTDYEQCIRNNASLGRIKEALQKLLGEEGFKFNLMETYGQPQADLRSAVSLESDRPGVRTFAAPVRTDSTPGHDMPSIAVGNLPNRMPLTFDFYMALRLRSEGCAGSSLPVSVRAALDRVRHKHAGSLCRSFLKFVDGTAQILLQSDAAITLQDEGGTPVLTEFNPA